MKKTILKTLLIAALCGLTSASSSAADTVLTFGTDSPTAGKGKASGPAEASLTVTEEKDAVQVQTPNFWSTNVQYEGVDLDLSLSKPKSSLAIEVKGTVTGKNPTLRVIFFAPGWGSKSIWLFDLSEINPDNYTVVKATTPLSQPGEPADGDPLDVAGTVGILQILTKAEETNKPWDFSIKSIQLVE